MAINPQNAGLMTVSGNEELKELMKDILPMGQSITLVGDAGVGKTALFESIQTDCPELKIDKTFILRLSGIASEDMRLPIAQKHEYHTEDGKTIEEKYVEFIEMGVFKEIKENPDKQYLLFLDEINRADVSMIPLLFGLLEGKGMDGKKMKNCYIVSAVNYGDEYEVNIDFEADHALRRRSTFIYYRPNKEDIVKFMKVNNYHKIVQEVVQFLDYNDMLNYDVEKAFEQTTQLGSFNLLSNFLLNREGRINRKYNYLDMASIMESYGGLFMTRSTVGKINEKLILLDAMGTIDIDKEIIQKGGIPQGVNFIKDKNGNEFDITSKEKKMDLMTKTLIFIQDKGNQDPKWFIANVKNILLTFKASPQFLLSIFTTMNTPEFKEHLTNFTRAMVALQKDPNCSSVVREIISELKTNRALSI